MMTTTTSHREDKKTPKSPQTCRNRNRQGMEQQKGSWSLKQQAKSCMDLFLRDLFLHDFVEIEDFGAPCGGGPWQHGVVGSSFPIHPLLPFRNARAGIQVDSAQLAFSEASNEVSAAHPLLFLIVLSHRSGLPLHAMKHLLYALYGLLESEKVHVAHLPGQLAIEDAQNLLRQLHVVHGVLRHAAEHGEFDARGVVLDARYEDARRVDHVHERIGAHAEELRSARHPSRVADGGDLLVPGARARVGGAAQGVQDRRLAHIGHAAHHDHGTASHELLQKKGKAKKQGKKTTAG
mmetsp:Transcript_11173/g.41721  ORF Transcript_11173/g.41721 Transcript_11173/m.41721 type:complete len:292 (-) Transcript_11173:736-1611(-)